MATTIQIKRSSTASGVPLATDLAVGELAVNLADKRLFTKQSDGTIIELSTNPTDLDAATLRIDGVEITASATELNSLDGLTATTAELNILDGVTATAIELNTLDGITASTAELNKLDGYTGSTAELNILDGVTATTAELNVLDGITATTTELNYVDGVTSSIQTQLDNKADDTTSPTLTLDGDVSGSATLTNLGDATLTVTVADDSHNHIVANVDGLQAALDGKATSAQGALADSAVQPNDDVTLGTVTADGLVLDNNDSVSIGSGNYFYADTSATEIGSATQLRFVANGALRQSIANNGDVSFYEDTGTTAKMVWDASAESLILKGNDLDLNNGTALHRITNDNTNLLIRADYGNTNANSTIQFSLDGTERMRIDSAGNVGIGTASPNANLDIEDTTPVIRLSGNGNNADNFNYGEIQFYNLDTSGAGAQIGASIHCETASSAGARGELVFSTNDSGGAEGEDASEAMRIDSSGNVGIGTASPSAKLDVGYLTDSETFMTSGADGVLKLTGAGYSFAIANNNTGTYLYNNGGGRALVFGNNETERARIDSSGNLLVGKTSSNYTTAGAELNPVGRLTVARSNGNPVLANRLGSDGAIIEVLKDGATVGSIGAKSSDLTIGTGDTGLKFVDGFDMIQPVNTTGADRDGAISLGYTGQRFKNLYLSGGVYLGGTGAANKLDDYEEGTWTPVVGCNTTDPTVTYTYQEGTYTKVGRVVYASGRVSWSSLSGGSGAFRITGLPFNILNSTAAYPQLLSTDYGGIPFGVNDTTFGGYGAVGTSRIQLTLVRNNGSGAAAVSTLNSSGYMYFNLIYQS